MIKINLDIKKDSYNWWTASQRSTHSIQWIKYLPKELSGKLVDMNYKEAQGLIVLFLEKLYKQEGDDLPRYSLNLNKFLNNYGDQVIKDIERITEKPIYRKTFFGYITTFPKGPYNTKKGEIGFIYKKSLEWQLMAFIHELLHMQFETYYKKLLDDVLTKDQFQYLKESMTVIINDEFKDIITETDKGFPSHQKLRKELRKIWLKDRGQSFKSFLDKAVKVVKESKC